MMPTDLHLFLDCHLQSIVEVTRELMGSALNLLPGELKMLLDARSQSWSAWVGGLQDGGEHGCNAFFSIRILVAVQKVVYVFLV